MKPRRSGKEPSYSWVQHHLFERSTIELGTGLRSYHRILENLLAQAEAEEVAQAETRLAEIEDPELREMLSDHYYPYHWGDTFLPQFRASFVVWAISVLELHLEWASRLAGYLCDTRLAYSEVSARSIVERYETFFSRLAGFEPPAGDLWARLGRAYIVRNALAHGASQIPWHSQERWRKLEAALVGFRGIRMECTSDVLELRREFCEDIVGLVEEVGCYLVAQLAAARDKFKQRGGQIYG